MPLNAIPRFPNMMMQMGMPMNIQSNQLNMMTQQQSMGNIPENMQ
jgi:hypothetical protein